MEIEVNSRGVLLDRCIFERIEGWNCGGSGSSRKLPIPLRIQKNGYVIWQGSTEEGTNNIYLHHLVMGKPPLGMVTDHIDGNPLNDALDNLMPLTPLDHMHISLDAQYERGYDRFEVVKVRNQLETYWGVIMAKRDLERLRGE